MKFSFRVKLKEKTKTYKENIKLNVLNVMASNFHANFPFFSLSFCRANGDNWSI